MTRRRSPQNVKPNPSQIGKVKGKARPGTSIKNKRGDVKRANPPRETGIAGY